MGKGTSIHYSPQIEFYKNHVDDRAIKVGGRKLIQTNNGYVIPLNMKIALPRMSLRPYSDKEQDNLPHVILTSEAEWYPSVLDLDIDDDQELYDAFSNDSDYTSLQFFDTYGDYLKLVEVNCYSRSDYVDHCVLYHTNKHVTYDTNSSISSTSEITD